MALVDKTLALKYLANSEIIFQKIKDSFLKSYANGGKDIAELYNAKSYVELHRYIHSLKGISLNLGSQKLYDDAVELISKIKKEDVNLPDLNQFINTLNSVYNELLEL